MGLWNIWKLISQSGITSLATRGTHLCPESQNQILNRVIGDFFIESGIMNSHWQDLRKNLSLAEFAFTFSHGHLFFQELSAEVSVACGWVSGRAMVERRGHNE